MKSTPLDKKIRTLEAQLLSGQQKLARLKRSAPSQPVDNYQLQTGAAPVTLLELFGAKRDLIVVHNMGRDCRYCTLWADGFNGLYAHLADRARFVVVSPDSPATQRKFATARGWRFPMVSGQGSTFIKDMGFQPSPDEPKAGVSTFRRTRGKIHRVAQAPFGPNDPFCSAWHLFALLAEGVGNWQPQYRY